MKIDELNLEKIKGEHETNLYTKRIMVRVTEFSEDYDIDISKELLLIEMKKEALYFISNIDFVLKTMNEEK